MTSIRSIAPIAMFTLTLSLLCPASLGAQTAPAAAATPGAEQQLIAADRSYYEALAGTPSDPRPDIARLQSLFGPEYTDMDENGPDSRAEVLQQIRHVRHLSFEYKEPHAVLLSPAAGYVTADVHYTWPLNGSPVTEHKRTTTLFALRDGKWIAMLHTEMPIANDREDIVARPEDSNPDLIAMRQLAVQVMSQVHIPGYAPFPFYPVSFDAGAAASYSDRHGAHEADFSTLPPPMQAIWNQWASYTQSQPALAEPSGEALFKEMFYRFFLVHELGHLIAGRVVNGLPEAERKQALENRNANAMEMEYVANRIATAWFRDHDPQYLARLVAEFRLIQSRLPNPVPPGIDPNRYLTENYIKLSADPIAYGWYQLYMVITVYNEPPKTFQQMLDTLPSLRYERK